MAVLLYSERFSLHCKKVLSPSTSSKLKGQLPEGSLQSLATIVTLNCRTLSSELQERTLSRLMYLCLPVAALQETRMIGRPVISTIYRGDADGKKVGSCAIVVRNDYNNLVEEFGSTSSICAFIRLRDRRGRKLWTVSAHEPAETAEDNSKDAFYDELTALLSKIASQEVVIGGVDANAKIGRTAIRCYSKNNPMCQENGIFGISGNVMERTSDSGDRLVNFREGLS